MEAFTGSSERKPEKTRGSDREEDDDTDTFEETIIVIHDIRKMHPLSLDTAPQRSDRNPPNATHPRRLKRTISKRGVITGLSFLTCFSCLCIYYYNEISTHPLLQKQLKRKIPNDNNADPALLLLYPELYTSSQNEVDRAQINKKIKLNDSKEDKEEEAVASTFSSLLAAIGYNSVNADKTTGNWNFDGPPIGLTDGVKVRPPPNERTRMTTSNERIEEDPIIYDSDATAEPISNEDVTTVSTSYSDMLFPTGNNQLHANDALKCSESVKNFVINATDGKDECDGLKKAYEKTCIDNSSDEEPTIRRRRNLNEHPKKRRRKLWDKLNTPIWLRWRAYVYQTVNAIKRQRRILLRAVGYIDSNSVFFFAEDEVLKVWDDAQQLVDNNIQEIAQSRARRLMNEGQCTADTATEKRRRLQSVIDDNVGEPSIEKHETTSTGTITSLDLPMNSQDRLSDKSANDALLLQANGILMRAENESAATQDEADKSKKAVSDTGNAVSAILNDPTAKEALTCCSSILSVYHDICSTDVEEQVSDARLFFFVFVLACCGMVKSLIRHYKILWLPEAAGCILVGVISGYVLEIFPHHDVSFDGNWFLRILVPPIIFQAALSIDKRSFNRHIVPIIIYAVAGTLMATFFTAVIVYYGTMAFSKWCEPIPYIEALTFGALISSIDPIAVLSVLSNMGMNDTDTIYVLIFGESLLNDGVAIVLFHTLVHFLDETLIIDQEAIVAAMVHFFVVAFGSLLVGVASGMMSTIYFWAFHGCQTPLVEVLTFICWALLPYYVCDGIEWSGIVAAVAVGFVMDLHIIGQERPIVEDEAMIFDPSERTSTSFDSDGQHRPKFARRQIFSRYGHLSSEARTHIGFVTEIMATGMETAIFAYLGFFLISHRYHWNLIHMIIAIVGCCGSRAVMIPSLSLIANGITRIRQRRGVCRSGLPSSPSWKGNNPAGVIVDKKMQVALWFAGLRGAMSFALVESIPLYDKYSEQGTRLKPELKAMTSACIMFTVFVLGGYTYYILEKLGISPTSRRTTPSSNYEVTMLLNNQKVSTVEVDDDLTDYSEREPAQVDNVKQQIPGSAFRRPRHTNGEQLVMI